MAIINKSTNDKCWWEFEKKECLCTLGDNADRWSHYEKYRAPWNIYKNGSASWPVILLLGIYLKKAKTLIWRIYIHPYAHCSAIYNSQAMEATQVPLNKWVTKKAVVHTYNGILLIHLKKWNLTICNSSDGSRGCYVKWNKSEKNKYLWFHFCVKLNEQNKHINTRKTNS